MRKSKRLFKHQVLVTFISVFAVLTTMIGGSYALFSSSSTADEYNVLKVGDLEISYVDTGDGYGDVLSLNGAYPIPDSEGIVSSPYRFNITNTGSITADFKIKILYDEAIIEQDGCNDNLLSQEYIKIKFDNNEPILLSSLDSDGYVIYRANDVTPGSSEIHEIRLWIDENVPNSILGKHFHGKVVIESVQSGIDESYLVEYNIGDSVTLKDGSKWHVLENSDSTMATVKLLSDYNLTTTGEYNTTCTGNVCSPMVFDNSNNRSTSSYCVNSEYGCNYYGSNNTTVLTDSSVKTFLNTTYLSKLKTSLSGNGGNTDNLSVNLPSMEELAKVDGKTFNGTAITFNSSWITSTTYWTSTAYSSNSYYVWNISKQNGNSGIDYANTNNLAGVRPAIVTLKSNIGTSE